METSLREKQRKLLIDAAWELKACLWHGSKIPKEVMFNAPAIMTDLMNAYDKLFEVQHPNSFEELGEKKASDPSGTCEVKWECRVAIVSCGQRELESVLNEFGEEGWEVFQVRESIPSRPQEVLMRRQKVR